MALMDLETELQQSKVEVEMLKQCLKVSEEHAATVTIQTDTLEQTPTTQEQLTVQKQLAATQTELTTAQQDRTATQQELLQTQEQWRMLADELYVEWEKAEKFQNLFQEGQSQTRALEDEVKSLSERLQATCVELEQERNVLQLECY